MTSTDSTYGTKFTETEALLAVQSDDAGTLARLIDGMHPHERLELAAAASTLSDTLWDAAGRPMEWVDRTRSRGFRAQVEDHRAGL